jgi:peptidoglycan LD-endopeptidase CwlK
MAKFGKLSLKQLSTCCKELQIVANEVILYFDHSIVEGHRDKEAQNIAYINKRSQKPWPWGEHNSLPSDALDFAPYPIDWSDESKAKERFVLCAGFYLAIGLQKGYNIRWGGDWNRNMDTRDENFRDYGHIEIVR